MKKIDADYVSQIALTFSAIAITGITAKTRTDVARADLIRCLGKFIECCENMGYVICANLAKKLLAQVDEHYDFDTRFYDSLRTLGAVLPEVLKTSQLIQITESSSRYYCIPNLFGEAVFSAFPSAQTDIEEAGTCLALGRGTASVFHSMRVMEAGLRCIASTLDIEPQNDWGAYIRAVNKKLESGNFEKGKPLHSFFVEAVAHISTVKNAWRNPTMHIEKRYTTEEAEGILNAVKGFMVHLSSKLKEIQNDAMPISEGTSHE